MSTVTIDELRLQLESATTSIQVSRIYKIAQKNGYPIDGYAFHKRNELIREERGDVGLEQVLLSELKRAKNIEALYNFGCDLCFSCSLKNLFKKKLEKYLPVAISQAMTLDQIDHVRYIVVSSCLSEEDVSHFEAIVLQKRNWIYWMQKLEEKETPEELLEFYNEAPEGSEAKQKAKIKLLGLLNRQ